MANQAESLLKTHPMAGKTVYMATSSQADVPTARRFASAMKSKAAQGIKWHHQPMPTETHLTIYHPAATAAFRTVFKP
jgi:predicted alpha/beta superfamily hydrolase